MNPEASRGPGFIAILGCERGAHGRQGDRFDARLFGESGGRRINECRAGIANL